MGERGAGRFRVLDQGPALRDQPPRAEGGRRLHQALPRQRRDRARPRLGPLLWQFAPTKKFDEADFGGFLELLPDKFNGCHIRHVVEVRHDSFKTPEFIALLRKFTMPVVFTDHARYPNIADVTGDFVYARLQQGKDDVPTAYPPKAIAEWSKRLREWATAANPTTCSASNRRRRGKGKPRDVFAYVIHEGKLRAPAGAMALIEKVGERRRVTALPHSHNST